MITPPAAESRSAVDRFFERVRQEPDFLKPATRCMVVYAMVQYFRDKGVAIETIFDGVSVPVKHVQVPDNWIHYLDLVRLMKNCQDGLQGCTIYHWYEAGLNIARYRKSKRYRLMAELVGTEMMYRKVTDLQPTMNSYARVKLNDLQNGLCDISYTNLERFNRYSLGHAIHWVAGVAASIPIPTTEQAANARILYSQQHFENLIRLLYSGQAFTIEETADGMILIDEVPKAQRVELKTDQRTGLFLPEFVQDSRTPNAIFVFDPVVKNGTVFVKAGEIFDAPYGRFRLTWVPERKLFFAPWKWIKDWRKTTDVVAELQAQIRQADQNAIEAQIARQNEEQARLRAEAAEMKVREYAETLEARVAERSEALEIAQTRLHEAEKRALEHRITGGFAHEMRNALTGAQLELKSLIDYRDAGQSASGTLKASAAAILEHITAMRHAYGIPEETIRETVIAEFKTLADIADDLTVTLAGVSQDLDRGLTITGQIHDYARMSELKPGADGVDVVALLQRYRRRYCKKFGLHRIAYEITGAQTARVMADETHLDSIFSNLILNAKDALAEQGNPAGEIRADVQRIDGHVRVTIRDNGPGIGTPDAEEIFEPFFSTKPTTGTGLGLAIVRRLVTLYEGSIDIDSEPGRGTCFRVSLPELKD